MCFQDPSLFQAKANKPFTDTPFSTPESNTESHFQLYFTALGFCYRLTRHSPYANRPCPGGAPGPSVNLPSTGSAVRGQNHAAGRTTPSVLHSTAHGTQEAWPYLISSYVSPRSGLNGLPVLSHWEATADTAKAATHCKQHTGHEQSPPGRGPKAVGSCRHLACLRQDSLSGDCSVFPL